MDCMDRFLCIDNNNTKECVRDRWRAEKVVWIQTKFEMWGSTEIEYNFCCIFEEIKTR